MGSGAFIPKHKANGEHTENKSKVNKGGLGVIDSPETGLLGETQFPPNRDQKANNAAEPRAPFPMEALGGQNLVIPFLSCCK
ncbi:hypothetical protein EYF80_036592 [Liparis tanakae]|uniref:Uncharacterized protein n=1 Tax=Liparis tanakae TaxID=230148 RepID=A0A4Z2GIW1_9TELE|nr:hypothetical protein EYF80_036592 [Liparis tanakae]